MATVVTREEALNAVNASRPGLVLADIQLADGSSGIDAVKDIFARFQVPVIFNGQRWTEAIAVLRPQADGGEPTTQAQLAFLLARSGEREQAVRIHESLLAQWRRGGGAYPVAVVYVGLGDFDEAFIWLDRSIADRSLVGLPGDQTHLMLLDPLFAELRRDPRFRTWSDGMGLQDL